MNTRALLIATFLASGVVAAQAADLKIALKSDPDVLDPDQSRTFAGRIVYTALCDKLVDITPDLELVPQLATGWSWNDDNTKLTMELRKGVTFHDGKPFDAQAVAYNINRSKTLDESRRKSELSSVDKVEVLGDYKVQFDLAHPDATLLTQLADRSGMMISPAAAKKEGVNFGNDPVCSGPFKFKERVSQDRIVLTKFKNYWNADKIHFDTVTYVPIPDSTVRLANLQSGDVQMIEELAATDLNQVQSDPNLRVEKAVSLGYQGVTFNVANGPESDNPWGKDARLRRAFSYALDRNAINQVVFNGAFEPGNQPFSPNSRWYDKDYPVPARNVAKAKELLSEAGYPEGLDLEINVVNSPVPMQLVQTMQAMENEAGIHLKIVSKEYATLLSDDSAGKFKASQVGWSGRVDPDGNIQPFVAKDGAVNDSFYSNDEVDRLISHARTSNDFSKRKSDYDAARKILDNDTPVVYLYHPTWIWALNSKLKGFQPSPDGMIRLENLSLSK